MYNTIVIYLLSLVLIVYGGTFIIRNFLVDYKASENGFKNIAVILMMVFSVIVALAAAADAWSMDVLMDELQFDRNIGVEIRQLMERNIAAYKRDAILCIILGYVMSIVSFFIYKNIEQEIHRNLNRSKERWNWSKIGR